MSRTAPPFTAHTTNLVPLCLVGVPGIKLREGGRLADIAPHHAAGHGPASASRDGRQDLDRGLKMNKENLRRNRYPAEVFNDRELFWREERTAAIFPKRTMGPDNVKFIFI